MTAYVYNEKTDKIEECRARDPKTCKYHVHKPHWNSWERASEFGEYSDEQKAKREFKASKLAKPGAKAYKIWDKDLGGWAEAAEEEFFETKKRAQSSITDVINEAIEEECEETGNDSDRMIDRLSKQFARRFVVKPVSPSEIYDSLSTYNDYDEGITEGQGDF